MNEQADTNAAAGNFWSRRSRKAKAFILIGGALLAFSAIGAMSSPSEKEAGAPGGGKPTAVEQTSAPADEITGRVAGTFDTEGCFGCGELKEYIHVSDAWCGWSGEKVLVGVTMKNTAVEHVTVDWHPSYTIVGGSEHGAGLSSLETSGFDAGETRQLVSEQNPDGLTTGTIGKCKPSFYLVEAG
jgi:hypothetical protein